VRPLAVRPAPLAAPCRGPAAPRAAPERYDLLDANVREIRENSKFRMQDLVRRLESVSSQGGSGGSSAASSSGLGDRSDLKRRLAAAVGQMQEGLIERDTEVRLLLLAALSGEHILYIGPPGTAKSELGRRLSRVTRGSYFERLLTRFSVPEELFGPLSMRALEEDQYVRQTQGYLPDCKVAFIDEVRGGSVYSLFPN
jgi:MoxR-like ATPase